MFRAPVGGPAAAQGFQSPVTTTTRPGRRRRPGTSKNRGAGPVQLRELGDQRSRGLPLRLVALGEEDRARGDVLGLVGADRRGLPPAALIAPATMAARPVMSVALSTVTGTRTGVAGRGGRVDRGQHGRSETPGNDPGAGAGGCSGSPAQDAACLRVRGGEGVDAEDAERHDGHGHEAHRRATGVSAERLRPRSRDRWAACGRTSCERSPRPAARRAARPGRRERRRRGRWSGPRPAFRGRPASRSSSRPFSAYGP